MIKKLQLLFFFSIFLSVEICSAQAATEIKTPVESSEIDSLLIKWRSVEYARVLRSVAKELSGKFPDKIRKVDYNNAQSFELYYYHGKILKEDILQVIRAEGIYTPYFIENQKRYFLNKNGLIDSEPVK